jgi:hypothetical protein
MNVRIPADIDREDQILPPFTARQVAVMAVTGLVLYGGWQVTSAVIPVLVYVLVAVPIGVAVSALVVVRRDGITLDRLLLAAVRQRLQPRRQVAGGAVDAEVPEWISATAHGDYGEPVGALDLPAKQVDEAGVVDLGSEGLVLIGACSTVNFALRTPAEQDALIASFGRYLHSLASGVQVLVRAQRLDLSGEITELHDRAAGLPHPALAAAARDHADYLAYLGSQADLLRRQILLVLREPVRRLESTRTRRRSRWRENEQPSDGARRAASSRLLRRMNEAAELLSPAGIAVTQLDTAQATAVLADATNPDSPLPASAELAGADEVITVNEEDFS